MKFPFGVFDPISKDEMKIYHSILGKRRRPRNTFEDYLHTYYNNYQHTYYNDDSDIEEIESNYSNQNIDHLKEI